MMAEAAETLRESILVFKLAWDSTYKARVHKSRSSLGKPWPSFPGNKE